MSKCYELTLVATESESKYQGRGDTPLRAAIDFLTNLADGMGDDCSMHLQPYQLQDLFEGISDCMERFDHSDDEIAVHERRDFSDDSNNFDMTFKVVDISTPEGWDKVDTSTE